MSSVSIALIRSQVESRIPGALRMYDRPAQEMLPTGIPAIDRETGGIPKSALTQICAPVGVTSGRTTVLLSLLAQVTRSEQFCALVDACDSFDPQSAKAMGVCLSRLLWVRCGDRTRLKSLEHAFKAADLLLQNGGFGLIVLDLGDIEENLIRKIPLVTWFRFTRVIETMPAALVVLLTHSAAQSCAGLTLHIGKAVPQWRGLPDTSHGQILSDVQFNVEVARTRTKKPAQGVRKQFSARAQWA
jgi:recombination protein RecA